MKVKGEKFGFIVECLQLLALLLWKEPVEKEKGPSGKPAGRPLGGAEGFLEKSRIDDIFSF